MNDKIIDTITNFTDKVSDYMIIISVTFVTGIAIITLSKTLAIQFFGDAATENINLFATSFLSAAVTLLAWTQLRK